MSFVTVSSGRNKAFVQTVLAQDAATIAAQEAEIARRVRQEVAKLRDKAEAEGRAVGEAAAREAVAPEQAALASAVAALQAACLQLTAPLAQKERDLADLVTELSFLLAKHIIGADVESGVTGLASLVKKLLDEAAAERGPRQTLRLRLNPVDHARLVAQIPPETAELLTEEKIAPGGAMVEIISPGGDPLDKIEWDATRKGRVETICAALGLQGAEP
jgi:flagellar assembly protein FliH